MRHCLNLGSGRDYRKSTLEEAWVNVDHNTRVNPDIVHDMNEPLPFGEDVFDHVRLVHVLEHCDDLFHVMEEVWRVSKPGASVKVICPYYTSAWAWGDPTHKHAISEGTFMFFSYPVYEENARNKTSMSQLFPKCDFDVTLAYKPFPGEEVTEYRAKHLFNVIDEIHADLTAVKPLRSFDLAKYQ